MVYDKSNIFKVLAACGILVAHLMLPKISVAQDCRDLGNDPEWVELSQKMNDQIMSENYDEAKKLGDQLLKRCPLVPSTNYIVGRIYQKLGDYKSAHTHFSIATDNTEEFSVDKTILKDMWYARYESEYPDAYALRKGGAVTMSASDIQTIKDANEADMLEEMEISRAFMWTGVGLGIAGAVLAISGGIWIHDIMQMDKGIGLDDIGTKDSGYYIDINKDKLISHYVASYVMLGVGITGFVAGTVIASINGILYSRLKTEKKVKESIETSIDFSYNSVTFNMTF